MKPKPRTVTVPFLHKDQLTEDVVTFYFDRSGMDFPFLPGQYANMILPHEADDKGSMRFFTISSSPNDKKFLALTTNRGQTTFKNKLFDLQPGQTAQLFGPIGNIFLTEEETEPQVYLAGGIGIVPFWTILQYAAEKKSIAPITLIVSFSKKSHLLYYEELSKIAKENHAITVVYSLSRDRWEGEQGRISNEMIRKYISDITKPVFSIVGPPEMVTNTEQLLLTMGVDPEKIKTEPFIGY